MKYFYAVVLLTVTATTVPAEENQYKGFPRGNALITVQELKRLIDANTPQLVLLAAENNVEYRLGHIPGSYQVDRPAIEAPPETQNGVSGNLIDADSFTKLARNLGINRDSIIEITISSETNSPLSISSPAMRPSSVLAAISCRRRSPADKCNKLNVLAKRIA